MIFLRKVNLFLTTLCLFLRKIFHHLQKIICFLCHETIFLYFCNDMKKTTVILLLFALYGYLCKAEVRLPQIFQSGMVLQRGTNIPVWGQADAFEMVTVTLNKKTCITQADANGHWRVDLPAMKAGGPYTLEVNSKLSSNNSKLSTNHHRCDGRRCVVVQRSV